MDSAVSAQPVKPGFFPVLLQALFPENCLLCDERLTGGRLICRQCEVSDPLKPAPEFAPERYGRQFGFLYEGSGKALLKAAKFGNRRRARNFWIAAARPLLTQLAGEKTKLLALPSSKPFLRQLLQAVVPPERLVLNAFRTKRSAFFGNDANKFLGEAARYRRIHDSLQWNNQVIGEADRYIICDDVSTTGATLIHAARLTESHLRIAPERITIWALLYRPREFADHLRTPRQ